MASTSRWRVLRQDDNGNVYVVTEVDSEERAQAIAAAYEAHAHKQMYFVAAIDDARA
jgi:hypothetical protein